MLAWFAVPGYLLLHAPFERLGCRGDRTVRLLAGSTLTWALVNSVLVAVSYARRLLA